jgi:hypothetical protein
VHNIVSDREHSLADVISTLSEFANRPVSPT